LDHRKRLLELYEIVPFHRHPMWRGVLEHQLTLDEVIAAERQHYLRTRAGQLLRTEAVTSAKAGHEEIWKALLSIYLEEVAVKDGPSHLDLIQRLCVLGGVTLADLETTVATAGNAAAMAFYREIASRGAACHLLGAGVVEHFYSALAPKVYTSYTGHYGMSPEQAETYRIHGPMDHEHAERSLAILPIAMTTIGWTEIERSVRDALIATSLHYDGMLQGATGKLSYWNGADK
jgi:pyrroloquinoline quinone (PQQ) biosynthesis protein C